MKSKMHKYKKQMKNSICKKIIATILLASIALYSQAQFGGGIGSGYASGGTNANVPLPVYSIELSAHKSEQAHELQWTIVSSSAMLHIELEYSRDQVNWKTLYGEISSNIFSNSYVNKAIEKTNYYRLKVTDLDNSVSYSNIIFLAEKEMQVVSIYPNPVANNLNVNYTNLPYQLSVYNSQGQLIIEKEINNEQTQLNTKNWSAGTYYLNIDKQITQTIIKQ